MKNAYEFMKDYMEDIGLQVSESKIKKWTTVDVYFTNPITNREDNVEFDIKNLTTNKGYKELGNLFTTFCKENGFNFEDLSPDSISIDFVRSAKSYELLMQLEAEEEGYFFREE